MCVCCNENEATAGRDLCPRCVLAVRAEIETGLVRMQDYLKSWAEYSDWCELRGLAA